MSRHDELLAAVLADPSRETCAVYADHLLELGDVRGELIVTDIALRDLRARNQPERLMARRRRELLAQHARAFWPWPFVFQPGTDELRDGTRFGFLGRIAATTDELEPVAGELFAREPIRDLELSSFALRALPNLFASAPRLQRFRLHAYRQFDDLARIFDWPALAAVKELEITSYALDFRTDLGGLLPEVQVLRLSGVQLDAAAAATFAAWSSLRNLVRLDLNAAGIDRAVLAVLLAGGPFPALVRLELDGNPLGDAGVALLAEHAAAFPSLRQLRIRQARAPGAAAILHRATWPSGLDDLRC